jgi:glucose/arabinose dehydrogenase/PKD repeat protein
MAHCMNRITAAIATFALATGASLATTVPPGFEDLLVASPGFDVGVMSPTALAFHPQTGDLWVTEKGDGLAAGTARVRVLGGSGGWSTAATLTCLDSRGERGLLDVAFDPDFPNNHFVYLFTTRRRELAAGCPQPSQPASVNVISRFVESGGTLGGETVLLEGPPLLETSELHNGGSLRFLPDGTLLISMGDNAVNTGFDLISQRLDDLRGKILRIRRDGSVPADNPFVGVSGALPQIYAMGFRNPFRMAVHPETGSVLVADVGETQWEELDLLLPGRNYGWPCYEASQINVACPPAAPDSWTFPVLAYHHGTLSPPISGNAVVAGPVYTGASFPPEYQGSWFFADYARRWIRRGTVGENGLLGDVEEFATAAPGPVDLKVGPDGCLYYAAIISGEVRKTCYAGGSNGQPTAAAVSEPRSGPLPLEVFFSSSGSSDPEGAGLAVTWRFGDGQVAPQANTSHIYSIPGVYETSLRVDDRSGAPNATDTSPPILIVAGNDPPGVTLQQPQDGARYQAGQMVSFSGSAQDPQDGALAASSLAWTVIFHHADHVHPFLGPIAGVAGGSFTIPAQGEGDPNVAYEVVFSATDSGAPVGAAGRVTTTARAWLLPLVSRVTLAADPAAAGLSVGVDGVLHAAPHAFDSVAGWPRVVSAAATQSASGRTFTFASWSDGGAATHGIQTPATDATWTARYTCPSLEVPSDLQVSGPVNGWITLTWKAATDLCLEDRAFHPRYAVYRSTTARPASPPGSFPGDPAFSLVAVSQAPSLSVLPASPFEVYLVVTIGRDGSNGPAGHYGTGP